VRVLLRVVVAGALVTEAAIHIWLALGYQLANPAGIGQGNLFYAESVVAIVVALYVLIRGTRLAFFAALLVLGSALAAVVVTAYVDLPQLGPIPPMYEPVWFVEKSISALVEGVGALLALVSLFFERRRG
jgi:hypothetical protein